MKNRKFKTSKEKFEYAKKIILSCRTYPQLGNALNLCPILKDKWSEIREWVDYQKKILEIEDYREQRYIDKMKGRLKEMQQELLSFHKINDKQAAQRN